MGVMFVRNDPNFPGMTRLESIFVWMRKSYLFRACFTLPFCCPASRIGNTHTARLHQFLDQPLRAHNQLAPLPLDLRHPRPSPSVIAEKLKLTQKLLILINADRTARGHYPFAWNATSAGGARLHAWNMVHWGFSHTCPDGRGPCQRIADEEDQLH